VYLPPVIYTPNQDRRRKARNKTKSKQTTDNEATDVYNFIGSSDSPSNTDNDSSPTNTLNASNFNDSMVPIPDTPRSQLNSDERGYGTSWDDYYTDPTNAVTHTQHTQKSSLVISISFRYPVKLDMYTRS
jgi:hypothetical protein